MGDQTGPGADVEHLLVLRGSGQVDQARRHPSVLTARPGVVMGGDAIEKVDDMVDHLVRRIRIHQGHSSCLTFVDALGHGCYDASSLKSWLITFGRKLCAESG